MLEYLRAMFRISPDTDRGFIKAIGKTDVFVIAATESEGIDATSLSKEQLLAEIQRESDRDRELQKEEPRLFTYTQAGQHRLPFFTSADHAQRFCGDYSREHGKVLPFRVLQIKGRFLGKIDPDEFHSVIMNDRSPEARALTARELTRAQKLWG